MRREKKTRHVCLKMLAAVMLGWFVNTNGVAQFTRSTYFMDGTVFRQQLNPALTPDRGYVNIPLMGSLSASATSNTIGMQDAIDIIENSSDADYFMSDKFINRLKQTNKLNLNFTNDLVSFGWYKGKGFWSANLSIKTDAGVSLPKSMFNFLRDMRGAELQNWLNYNMASTDSKATINSYLETAVGYAHPIGSRLTVGGKLKMLFGIANIKMNINNIAVQTKLTGINPNQDWSKITEAQLRAIRGEASIASDATIEASMAGFELTNGDNGLVKDIRRKGSLGVAGTGFGVDLGAAYRVTKDITLSASLLDLGFISWSKSKSHVASSNTSRKYLFDAAHLDEAREFQELMASGELLNMDLLQIKQTDGKGRTTPLYATLVFGGEYKLLNDKLSLGLLSTTRFTQPESISELTLSSAYKVSRHVGFSLTYSMLQGNGSGLGVGMRLGPVTIATDYVCFSKDARTINALIGISIPLGSRKVQEVD